MDSIKVTYKVTERVSIRREGDSCVLETRLLGSHDVHTLALTLEEAWSVGTVLRDVSLDALVLSGFVGEYMDVIPIDPFAQNHKNHNAETQCNECGGTGTAIVTSSPGFPEHGSIEQESCSKCK